MKTEINQTMKGPSIGKASSKGPVSRPKFNDSKLRKLVVKLGNAYVRLTAPDRLIVMRLREQFTLGKTDDMKSCYLQLKSISPEMAIDLRRLDSELLEAKRHYILVLQRRKDELLRRGWTEEP